MPILTLVVDLEIRALIPPPLPEERAQLEQNLLAEGCRDALVVWAQPDGVSALLLDGHTRLDICQAHGLTYPVAYQDGLAGREDAINWVIDHQLGRRNLTAKQKSYLGGLRYNREKKAVGRPAEQFPDNQGITADRLAQEHGVSRDTIEQDGRFAGAVGTLEQKVRQDIRTGILGRDKAGEERTTKKRVKAAALAIESGAVEPMPFMRRPTGSRIR